MQHFIPNILSPIYKRDAKKFVVYLGNTKKHDGWSQQELKKEKKWFYNLTLSGNLGKTTAAVINSYVMSALYNFVIHM